MLKLNVNVYFTSIKLVKILTEFSNSLALVFNWFSEIAWELKAAFPPRGSMQISRRLQKTISSSKTASKLLLLSQQEGSGEKIYENFKAFSKRAK
jgi:hypothetical protein